MTVERNRVPIESTLRRLWTVAFMWCVACGDNRPDDSACEDNPSGGYVALSDFNDAYKAAYCTFLTRSGLFPDQASCLLAWRIPLNRIYPDAVGAVMAGKATYDGYSAWVCIDALASGSRCDAYLACDEILRGVIPDGGECFNSTECISRICAPTDCGASCCPGTCYEHTMTDPPPDPMKPAGASCVNDGECDDGLACVGPSGGEGPRLCARLPAIGEPCVFGRCAGSAYCDANRTCQPVGLPGAPCTSSYDCSQYYFCDTTTGTCAQGPLLGESCANALCFDASYCEPTTNICTALKADGETCISNFDCQSGLCGQLAGCLPLPSCY